MNKLISTGYHNGAAIHLLPLMYQNKLRGGILAI